MTWRHCSPVVRPGGARPPTRAYVRIDEQGGRSAFASFRDSFDLHGAQNPFAAGQLAAAPMEDSYLDVLAAKSPQAKVTVAPFRGVDGQPVNWITGNAWAIPAAGENAETRL